MRLRAHAALLATAWLSAVALTGCHDERWRATPPPPPLLIEAAVPPVVTDARPGPRVLVAQVPATATIHLELVVRGGYATDPAAQLGVTRLLGRALLEGSGGRDRGALFDRFGEFGAEPRVSVDDDGIGISVQVRPEHAEAAVLALADTIANPTLDPLAFQRVQREALETLRLVADDPNALATLALGRAVLDVAHAVDVEGLGAASAIAEMSVDDVRQRLAGLLDPSRAALVCVGDVELADARRWADQATASWGRGPAAASGHIALRPISPRQHIDFVQVDGLSQAIIAVGGPLLSPDDAAEPAQTVARDLAGGMVQFEIRSRRQLSYGVLPVEISTGGGGVFGLSAKVDPAATRDAIEAVFAAFAGAREQGLGAESIQQARRAQVVRSMVAQQSFDFAAHTIREAFERGADSDAESQRLDRMIGLRESDVDAAFRRDFDPKRLRLVIVGPARAVADLRDGTFGAIRRTSPDALVGVTPPPLDATSGGAP
jgi:zinc protease